MSMCAIHAIRAIRATVYMLCMLFTIGATGAMRTIHKGGVAIRTIGAKELHSDYRDYSAYSSAKFFPDDVATCPSSGSGQRLPSVL